jgi:hypothetical protein
MDEEGVYCVAKPPYYGPDTNFFGEDTEQNPDTGKAA